MRQPLIAGNWKMHRTVADSRLLARGIRELLGARGRPAGVEIVVCPPFPALAAVGDELSGSSIDLGAQNLFWEPEGAFTGEVSASMLRAVGASYVIIGHSERRQHFGETDEWVSRKLAAALKEDLIPIVCLGETLAEREGGRTHDVIRDQFNGGMAELREDDWKRTIIAYEPVWAIGTGRTATTAQAVEVHTLIRDLLRERSDNLADEVRILYGGSVKAENAKSLLDQDEIDGALVGGASLVPESFTDIVRSAAP
jgi:triosephosphate isomerase